MALQMIQIADNIEIPIHRRIADAVCEAVASGRMTPGDKLPAHLSLADSLGVNPTTVRRAYELLENQGIVLRKQGSGTYIQSDALGRVQRVGQRRIEALKVVLGVPSLAQVPRETLFITVDMLDGIRDVLGPEVAIQIVDTLVGDEVEAPGAHEAVLLVNARPPAADALLAAQWARQGVPVAASFRAEVPLVPYVAYDRRGAAALACQHLIDSGHRRIGFIGVRAYQDTAPTAEKFLVYTSLLQEAGLDIRARDVRHASVRPGEAYAAAWELAQGGDVPEALFVDTDYKAMEVIHALHNAGLKVPEDVAIVAYDDIPEAAAFTPRLTTVSVPRREIGRRAARILQDWPGDGTLPASVVLKASLIVRDSSAAKQALLNAKANLAS